MQLTEEANEFLDKVSPAAARKIEFVIRRVMSGDKDRTIFKKLEGTDIWEFRILYAEQHTDCSPSGIRIVGH